MKVSPGCSSWTASSKVIMQAPSSTTSADSRDAVCFGNGVPSVPSMRLVIRTSPFSRETVFFTEHSLASKACMLRPAGPEGRSRLVPPQFGGPFRCLLYSVHERKPGTMLLKCTHAGDSRPCGTGDCVLYLGGVHLLQEARGGKQYFTRERPGVLAGEAGADTAIG